MQENAAGALWEDRHGQRFQGGSSMSSLCRSRNQPRLVWLIPAVMQATQWLLADWLWEGWLLYVWESTTKQQYHFYIKMLTTAFHSKPLPDTYYDHAAMDSGYQCSTQWLWLFCSALMFPESSQELSGSTYLFLETKISSQESEWHRNSKPVNGKSGFSFINAMQFTEPEIKVKNLIFINPDLD